MKPTDHITFKDLRPGAALRESLSRKFEAVVIIDAETKLAMPAHENACLLIGCIQNVEQLGSFLLETENFNCPILLLLPHGFDLSAPLHQNPLIDILELPTTNRTLQQRITFLLGIHQIVAQQQCQKLSIHRQLDLLYSRDALTGLFNRKHFNTILVEKMRDRSSANHDICLLVLNIDYFNSINRSLGFEFGDAILNQLGARLTETSRKEDVCFRYSGEEFVILHDCTGLATAQREANRLSRACTREPFRQGEKSRHISLSGGLVSMHTHKPCDHEEFICMMETALFVAKAEGRNRICTYTSPIEPGKAGDNSMAILRENLHRILEKTRRSAIDSLKLLTRDIAGPEYNNHIEHLSHYTTLLAEELGLPDAHRQTFQNSITLYNSLRFLLHHDLLNSPTQFTDAEKKIVADLPAKLEQLTDMFDYFTEEKRVLLCHGERYDGQGYPMGLSGDEIPLGSRIFTLANALAAMSSPRPFRPQLPANKILNELIQEAGGQFDPGLVHSSLIALEKSNAFGLDSDFYGQIRSKLYNSFPELRQ